MQDINLIDIEASGLHPDSYPIEIAIRCHGEIHCWLIAPAPSWGHWCREAEAIHGITRETLFQQGKAVAEVAHSINKLLAGCHTPLYSDARDWDGRWLDRLFVTAQVPNVVELVSIYDTMSVEQALRFNREFKRLATSGQYTQHRAADDVKMIYQAYCTALV